MADVFWHKPIGDRKFHAYNMQDGAEARASDGVDHHGSLCKKWLLVGLGMPAGASKKMPKKRRCGACLRKMNGK